ncbi:ATP-binding protein [Vibrio hannami]|uniref:ATP-binding protein n=1 Tax=Vibrio hannami TaxID=2717094 RepID=UPI00240FC3BF|nr:ATP-binding protein [Vibrio hannami]MDG3085642.1 ATP-binding protein [Vibrio hannami]
MNKLAGLLFKNNEKLSLRLLFWILLLSSGLAIIATTIQLYADYRDSKQSLESSLDNVEETVLPALAVAAWKLDKDVMDNILVGLLAQSGFLYAEILDTYDHPITKHGQDEASNSFDRVYPIIYVNNFAENVLIGRLKVTATLDEIYQQLLDKAIIILLTQAFKTFLMSICIIALVERLVIRHLNALSNWATDVDLSNPDQFLTLPPRHSGEGDAIDKVNIAINTMQSNLIKALEEREKAEQLTRSIIDNTPSLIFAKDAKGRYTMVNQRYLDTFGFEWPDVIGKTASELFSHSISDTLIRHDRMVIEKRSAIMFEEEMASSKIMHDDNAQRFYLSAKFPIFDENGELLGTGGVSTDITERREKEHQIIELNESLEDKVRSRTEELEVSLADLKNTQAQLVESEKMSALGNLVAGVAHEINTPLGVSITATSHLCEVIEEFEKEYKENRLQRESVENLIEVNQESLHMLTHNLGRAVELIRNFKQVAVDQSSEVKREFELKKYIEELNHSLTPQLKIGGHAVSVESNMPIEMNSYPGALAQIITNLIMNSINHGFKDKTNGQIHINLKQMGERVILDYQDNGVGLSETQRKKVFDPFYTTRRGSGGSGLGMSISYNLTVKTLGGQIICIESDKGAHFRMSFPTTV